MDPNIVCIGCGAIARLGATCERCRSDIRVRAVLAAAQYDDPIVRQLIQLTKYAPAVDVAGAFALFINQFAASPAGQAFREDVGADAVIVPVPLHWWRQRRRGFNQSEIIAAHLATAGFGTVVSGLLRRTRTLPWNLHPQAHLPRAERLRNVTNAFFCTQPNTIRGRTIILVDDVVTTGATLSACARTLHPHGARTISAFALAREP